MNETHSVEHMLPCLKPDQAILAQIVQVFGRKGRVVEVALDWAIEHQVPNDPRYPSFPQIHVHLSKNYREQYEPSHLGTMLHTAIHEYWTRYKDGIPAQPGVWYWPVDLPKGVIELIETTSFDSGKSPEVEFSEIFRVALQRVREGLPKDSVVSVEVATDPSTRKLFQQVQAECDTRRLDIDTLLVPLFVEETRKRHP